jgi:hypothetical protein
MSPADRYAAILPRGVRERSLLEAPQTWSELELQACWFAGDFGRDFRTAEGQTARIIQFGVWNHEAGPDFSHAAVSFEGGPPKAGAIEFDMDVRDWERHGHGQNPAYEAVVLHVYVTQGGPEFFTRTVSHRSVPQVLLDPAILRAVPPGPLPEAKLGRCSSPLVGLEPAKARAVLLGAAEYRLRRKAAALARLCEAHGPDEALYQALAAALGYKSNKLPFTVLAQRLPLKLLQKRRGEIEALLFGVSGFLPERELSQLPPDSRKWVTALWHQWWALRGEFAGLALAPKVWRLSGQRPVNHPQRRLAALAQIVLHWRELQRLAGGGGFEKLGAFFAGLHDPHWERHYTLHSRASKSPMALLGDSRISDIMLNVFLPLQVSRDAGALETFRAWRAPMTNRRVEVAATRLFGEHPERRKLLQSAAVQQGLLQIYEDFCLQDASDCANCRFPEQLLQWSE